MKVLTRLTGAAFPNTNDIDDIFNHIDTDGDETISYSEYCQLVNGFTSLMEEERIKLKFKTILE